MTNYNSYNNILIIAFFNISDLFYKGIYFRSSLINIKFLYNREDLDKKSLNLIKKKKRI